MSSIASSLLSTDSPLSAPRPCLVNLPVETKLIIADMLDIRTAKAVACTSSELQDVGEYRIWRVLRCALPESVARARKGRKDKGPLVPGQLASVCSVRLAALARRPIRRQAVIAIDFSVCRGMLDSQKAAQRRIVLLVGTFRLEAIRYHWVPRWMPDAFKSVDTLDLTLILQRDLGTLVFPNVTNLSLPRLPRDPYDFKREDCANRPVLHLLHCFPRLDRVVRLEPGAPREVVQMETVRSRLVYAMELARTEVYSYNRALLQPVMPRNKASDKPRPARKRAARRRSHASRPSSSRRTPKLSRDPGAPTTPEWTLPDLPLDIKFLIAAHLDIATAKAAALSCKRLQDVGEYRIWRDVMCLWDGYPQATGVKRRSADEGPLLLAKMHEARLRALNRRPVRGQAIESVCFSTGHGALASQVAAQRKIVQRAGLRLQAICYECFHFGGRVKFMHETFRQVIANTVYPNVKVLYLPYSCLADDGVKFDQVPSNFILYLLRCFPNLVEVIRQGDEETTTVRLDTLRTLPMYARELARPHDVTFDRFMR